MDIRTLFRKVRENYDVAGYYEIIQANARC